MAKYISHFQLAFLETWVLLAARQVPDLPLNLYPRKKNKTKPNSPNKLSSHNSSDHLKVISVTTAEHRKSERICSSLPFSSPAEAVLNFIFKCFKWLATTCMSFMLTKFQNPNAVHSCPNFIYNRIYFWTHTLCENHKHLQELCTSNKLKQI